MEYTMPNGAKIRVLGIGGGGGNAINNMIAAGVDGVDFISANTDFQDLERSLAPNRVQLGANLTRGLGAGGNPELGSKAAEEDLDKIKEYVNESDMVFITAGLGGGTGTGGAPIIARACKDAGALTVAVVTKPFGFEGKIRKQNAETGLRELRDVVDTLIAIPNDRLRSLADRRATVLEMFRKADNVLLQAVKGISDLIISPGHINVDFADVREVMSEMGMALMGTGVGRGENRAVEAAQQAISSPLLEDVSIRDAKAALINISAGADLGMVEFEEVSQLIYSEIEDGEKIYLGMAIDESLDDEMRVTVIATGIDIPGEKPKTKSLRNTRMPPRRDPMIPGGDYDFPDAPMPPRQPRVRPAPVPEPAKRRNIFKKFLGSHPDEEDLSIPTFIRRQAD